MNMFLLVLKPLFRYIADSIYVTSGYLNTWMVSSSFISCKENRNVSDIDGMGAV